MYVLYTTQSPPRVSISFYLIFWWIFKMLDKSDFVFLYDAPSIYDGDENISALKKTTGTEYCVYSLFAQNVCLNQSYNKLNLANMRGCNSLKLKNVYELYAPNLQYAKDIILPNTKNVYFSNLEYGNIYAINAHMIRIDNPDYMGIVFCNPNTNINSSANIKVRRFGNLNSALRFSKNFIIR